MLGNVSFSPDPFTPHVPMMLDLEPSASVQRVIKVLRAKCLHFKAVTLLFPLLRKVIYLGRDLFTLGRLGFFPSLRREGWQMGSM